MQPSDLPPRIAAKIEVDPDSGCWLWTGSISSEGYGHYGSPKKLVHRLVYELLVGPIPEGLHLDHVRTRGCLSRHCCWPEHLEPVTQAENNRRAMRSHCANGHEWTPENTHVRLNGSGRICRICNRESVYKRRRAMKSNPTQGKSIGRLDRNDC